jgi:drug/metabolite transporter (DMT)-like permease
VDRRDAALLIVIGAVWGAVYPLTAVVLRDLPPPAVVAARTAFAAAALLPFVLRRSLLGALRRRLVPVMTAAFLQATAPLLLLTIGQQHVTASVAGILAGSQPVWAAVLTILAEGSVRRHARQIAGVLVGLAGVALLFVRDLDASGTTLGGGLAVLGAAVLFGAGAVYIHRRLPEVPPLATAGTAMTLTTLVMAPVALIASPAVPGAATLGWLVVLGAGATGAPLALFYLLIQRVGAVPANLAAYLAPGFAVVYGVLFLRERPSLEALVGLALIVTGSLVVGGVRVPADSTGSRSQ